jgi:UDP-N-acetyl-alpha-D-muramoyl-L-alanyl-L-glutamate epimerase
VTDVELCVVHPPGQRFTAIEDPASVTGLPVVRITREIDPLVRRSDELGFLNGHVPVTAIITAATLVRAVLDRRDAVVLSNEWSASVPTLVHDGQEVNHQWSKGIEFEEGFARIVAAALGPKISVFSYLRCRSELWVAAQFSQLYQFHSTFRSCNRAFHQDRAARLIHWCGTCDKCCFIDLILSPFMEPADLRRIFEDQEPLENFALVDTFYDLMGLDPDTKPFECVGDAGECRAAFADMAVHPDRVDNPLADHLLAEVYDVSPPGGPLVTDYLSPLGPHHIPERYAPADLLVRSS